MRKTIANASLALGGTARIPAKRYTKLAPSGIIIH